VRKSRLTVDPVVRDSPPLTDQTGTSRRIDLEPEGCRLVHPPRCPWSLKKRSSSKSACALSRTLSGYSKLSVNEQHAQVEELNEIVRLCEQFRKSRSSQSPFKDPTADGMALVFYRVRRNRRSVRWRSAAHSRQCAPAKFDGHSQWTGQCLVDVKRTHQRRGRRHQRHSG